MKEKAPKKESTRPRTSYIQFVMENRDGIIKEFPDIKSKEIMVKLGEKWNLLPAKDKAEYKKKAKANSPPITTGTKTAKKRKSKDTEKEPKKRQRKNADPTKKRGRPKKVESENEAEKEDANEELNEEENKETAGAAADEKTS
eukprot:CAMPEP_0171459562 /NCGR_PEP_ID=MMETSP0945-20130129/4795_1 /TAXON_ID=109269 /ORGANISM="Vaucheria litorea, Strain CCMP2940" /LENGTH=142 /DNA_ID=CAMNT_0011985603 /DNA_START=122 /DNA_END=550 /DNA_ORIENTATION=-